ncbi:hypothetical protein [Methylobacterium segetis]|uniref:hypothetical protein n=1 Tax=Methylobacterium segetis TaxID=2488750 RepID=UPI0010510604|nr:hypothetical protein [Methylobacterium segetis]
MKANYIALAKAAIAVTLDAGDQLGDFVGPVEFMVPWPAPGNKEAAALAALVKAGDIVIADAEDLSPDVPEVISDRQFAQALAKQGVISKEEALAFVKRGEVPAALQAVIDGIPDDEDRFDVDMGVSGATTFERSNPSTAVLAAALGWSAKQMDDLWRFAATIR